MLEFLKKIASIAPADAPAAFQEFDQNTLAQLKQDPYQQKALHFLRPDAWVKSKLENCSIVEVTEVL